MTGERFAQNILVGSETSGKIVYDSLYRLLGPGVNEGELKVEFGAGRGIVFIRQGNKVGFRIVDQEEVLIEGKPVEYRSDLVRMDEQIATRDLPMALALDREPFDGGFERVESPTFDEIVATLRNDAMKFIRMDFTEGTLISDQGMTGVMVACRRQNPEDDWGVPTVRWCWNGTTIVE
ncbi:MAG: hypothetical protein A2784_04850 [Candidatus Chisholmbacteria bacterium RIFCSPHIGHO2_01_FULL_48_12]|uniref:Uncharacterized protein n=1 Tax=Candidatus Chisholmbacteria bacterium RIFCSPHIGHO2_01_FULL_48_12 TaxID=1797589 RepID=A0A1G1VRN5_9BACT|nr:MAG: hypothetical protein A2784_04850 [Candidatus Chisholmbacteria bacterium RIFCSPHIGHO2_01_FULL_48_12]